MAFADPLILKNNAAANVNFVLQSRFPNGADYVESTGTPNEAFYIKIRHSNAGASVTKGAKPVRRHLVQFVKEKLNTTTGKMERGTLNCTITNDPGASGVTTAMLYDLGAFVEDIFKLDANIDKLLRDEA